MKHPKFIDDLDNLGACTRDRGELYNTLRKFRTPQEAWNKCKTGNDMLWLLGLLASNTPFGSTERRRLAGCQTEIVISLARPLGCDEYGVNAAIDNISNLLSRYSNGEAVSAEQFESAARSAARSAWSAARSAESAARSAESAAWSAESAARSAARSAESAARSAESAARSAESAARSAAWSAESAAWSAESAARDQSLEAAADIVRSHYPKPPNIKETK